MFEVIKANGIGRERYTKELMQLHGGLDILSFVRIIRSSWIGRVNIMDSKIKVSRVFNNNAQRRSLRGPPKTDSGTV